MVSSTNGPINSGRYPKELSGRYLCLASVGSGGLGRVWRGRHVDTGRPVAIKIFDGLDALTRGGDRGIILGRLEAAIRGQARVNNPFVTSVIDIDMSHTPPFAVYELAEGGNLRQLLETGPLTPAYAINVFAQIMHGLKAAHESGVIHRDLKPENILFDLSGNVTITDFGVTSIGDRSGAKQRRAYIGYGSIGYMAPEQFKPNQEPIAASDIYALGIILYEMLVGRIPGRRSPMPSESVKGLPQAIDDLFDSMARDDLESRCSSLDDVIGTLAACGDLPTNVGETSAQIFTRPPMPMPGLADEEPDERDAPSPESRMDTVDPVLEGGPVFAGGIEAPDKTSDAKGDGVSDSGPSVDVQEVPKAPKPRAPAVPVDVSAPTRKELETKVRRPQSRSQRQSSTSSDDRSVHPADVATIPSGDLRMKIDSMGASNVESDAQSTESNMDDDQTSGSLAAVEQAARSAEPSVGQHLAKSKAISSAMDARSSGVVIDDSLYDGDDDTRMSTVVRRMDTSSEADD